jgi:hypothetical protein
MPLIWKVPEASGMVKAGNWELIYGFGPIQGRSNMRKESGPILLRRWLILWNRPTRVSIICYG